MHNAVSWLVRCRMKINNNASGETKEVSTNLETPTQNHQEKCEKEENVNIIEAVLRSYNLVFYCI
jgi:hypothetical protein